MLFHDELGEFYAPQLLSDVTAAAAAAGLGYLADSRPKLSEEAWFPSEACAEARQRAAGDWATFQQYMDFRDLRAFHSAIFARGEPDRRRDASRLKGLWARGDFQEVEPEGEAAGQRVFAIGGVRLTTNHPQLIALFQTLCQAYPEAAPLDGVAELESLESQIYRLFVSGVLRLSTARGAARREPGLRPFANPLARLQVARGERDLVTYTHASFRLEEPPLRELLPLLDGTRDREAIADSWAPAGVEAARLRESPELVLTMLAQAGVLGEQGS